MISFKSLAEEVITILQIPSYDLKLKLYTQDGELTTLPEKTRWIYARPDGILITLPDSSLNAEEISMWKYPDIDYDKFIEIYNYLRMIANQYGLEFTVKDYKKKQIPRKFAIAAKQRREEAKEIEEEVQRKINSGRYGLYEAISLTPGDFDNVYSSYTKTYSKHSGQIPEETEVRTISLNSAALEVMRRNDEVESIFISDKETGDAMKLPGTNPSVAKALLCYIARGGRLFDDPATTLIKMSAEYEKLRYFVTKEVDKTIKNQLKKRMNKITSISREIIEDEKAIKHLQKLRRPGKGRIKNRARDLEIDGSYDVAESIELSINEAAARYSKVLNKYFENIDDRKVAREALSGNVRLKRPLSKPSQEIIDDHKYFLEILNELIKCVDNNVLVTALKEIKLDTQYEERIHPDIFNFVRELIDNLRSDIIIDDTDDIEMQELIEWVENVNEI